MKILQVITSLQIGGAEKLLTDIVPMLKQRGYEVDILIFYGKDTPLKQQLRDAGVHIIEFSQSPNVYKLSYIGRLKKLMAQYDIIHTHNTFSHTSHTSTNSLITNYVSAQFKIT